LRNQCRCETLAYVQATSVSSDQLAEQLLVFWRHIGGRGNREFFALIEELDLSLPQMKLLDGIAAHEDEPSVKEISAQAGCSLPNASRTIDVLLRRGWLERREDEHDRRVRRVRLTPAGREVIERMNSVRRQHLAQFAAELSDEQRTRLFEALYVVPALAESDGTGA